MVYRSAIGGYRGTTVAVKVELQSVAETEGESDGSDEPLKDWMREVPYSAREHAHDLCMNLKESHVCGGGGNCCTISVWF